MSLFPHPICKESGRIRAQAVTLMTEVACDSGDDDDNEPPRSPRPEVIDEPSMHPRRSTLRKTARGLDPKMPWGQTAGGEPKIKHTGRQEGFHSLAIVGAVVVVDPPPPPRP